MAKIIKYLPKDIKPQRGFPALIGLPGFVGKLEGGRIDSILKSLTDKGIAGCGVLYDGIDEETNDDRNKKIVCNFSLESYIKDIEQAFQRLKEDEKIDTSRVGILASSISGAVFAYALARNRLSRIVPVAYASISPLVGYSSYANEATRAGLERAIAEGAMTEIPLPVSRFDRERNLRRVIPIACVSDLKTLDSIPELRDNYFNNGMEVLTLYGKSDNISSPAAIEQYHDALYGKKDDKHLIGFDGEGHDLPLELIQEPIVDFFTRNLLLRREAA